MGPAALLIPAGASLLAQLLAQKAQAEEARKNRIFEAEQQGFNAQKEGAANLGQNQQTALASLIQNYRSALGA